MNGSRIQADEYHSVMFFCCITPCLGLVWGEIVARCVVRVESTMLDESWAGQLFSVFHPAFGFLTDTHSCLTDLATLWALTIQYFLRIFLLLRMSVLMGLAHYPFT